MFASHCRRRRRRCGGVHSQCFREPLVMVVTLVVTLGGWLWW